MRKVFRIPTLSGRIARDVDDELAFHLETRVQRLIAEGMNPDEARREALRQFGDVAGVRDSCVTMDEQRERSMRRANVMSELSQDVVYALRTLRRNIGFTAVIVGALAIGIGANTAIFTIIDAVLVQTLPVAHPEQLVAIGNPVRVNSLSDGSPRVDLFSYPMYKDIVAQNQIFTSVLASGRADRLDAHIDGTSGEFEHPRGRYVSGNYFSVLGVRALRGRTFDASADETPGSSPVATISYGYWTRRFHNDPAVIGRSILVDGLQITIIGVAPETFTGEIVGASPDIWLPLTMQDAMRPNQRILNERNTSWLLLLGRLKPGATLAQAPTQIEPLLQRIVVANAKPQAAKAFLARDTKYFISSGAKGFSRVRGTFQAPLFTLMIGVALLLCIICANVANLLLARAIARGREMAVRLALGAGRARLVRQLLTESAVLALLSAGVGLVVAYWGSRGLLLLAGDGGTGAINLAMNANVLAFTVVVSVLAVALFGLAPALRASRVELATTMRANAHAVAGSALAGRGQRAPLGKMLIVGQVALSLVLLIGATMLVRSLRNIESVDVGLDRDHLVILDVDINAKGYAGASLASAVHALRDRLAAVPGVAAVTFSVNGIFSGTESETTVQVPGFIPRGPSDSVVAYDLVGPDYARGIGGRLIAGREFSASDEATLPRAAVVNQSFAQFYFPNQSAVGHFVRYSDSVSVEIIGVLADTRDHGLEATPRRRMYFSYVHNNDSLNVGEAGSLRLIVRTAGDPVALVQQLRRAVVDVDPSLPIDGVDPLATLMHQSIAGERLVARLATGFGALALLLAAVGLYGVMTYAITRRTGEIGLRVALGAQRSDVIEMVLFDAIRVVAIGVVIGLPLALAATRLLKAQLHDVAAADPISITLAIVVLTASAVIAVLIPAARAARVSPIVALRAD
jgi:predicted permease